MYIIKFILRDTGKKLKIVTAAPCSHPKVLSVGMMTNYKITSFQSNFKFDQYNFHA